MSRRLVNEIVKTAVFAGIVVFALVFMSTCKGSSVVPLLSSIEKLQLDQRILEAQIVLQSDQLASTTAAQETLIEQQRSRLEALTHDVFLLSDKPVITEADAICLVGSTMIQNITEIGKSEQAIFCGDLELLENDGGTRNSQRGVN